jgi:ferritin-like metal-binding protein YciE
MTTLKELLVNKIKALYDIESEIIKALPKLSEAATDEDLKAGFDEHLAETEEQARRLEEIFEILGEEPDKLESEAIRGLAKDGEWVAKNIDEGDARDANLIAAASYVEHYEMAGYMAAIMWAKELGENDVADLLKESLEEEEAADEKMSKLGKTITKRLVG